MTGTLVATLLALAWLFAALRFRRTPRWQGRTRILSGYCVHDLGPSEIRGRFNQAGPSSLTAGESPVVVAQQHPSGAGLSPTRPHQRVQSAGIPTLALPAPAPDDISRSAA